LKIVQTIQENKKKRRADAETQRQTDMLNKRFVFNFNIW